MKEMKLTFAKAEHLKRNAREAEDPKAVFQAMRSVFGDLVTEVQRSIGYFQNIDRSAKVGEIVVLGNAAKLPGLAPYLGKNLGHEVSVVGSFNRLSGAS
jgi:type IV pilus assembly protein PilM